MLYAYIYTFMLMLASFSTALGFIKKNKHDIKMELKNEHPTST